MKRSSWDVLDCVALAKRVLEQSDDSFEGEACGVIFRFRKEARDFNLASRTSFGDHWVVEDARPINGRWSSSKNEAYALVRSALRSEQGE